jgi:hypothetical protein
MQAATSGKRVVKRWTVEEHSLLVRLVEDMGTERTWPQIAAKMPGRTGKQCRERWLNAR